MDFSLRELAGVVSSSSALLFSTQINGPPIQQLTFSRFEFLILRSSQSPSRCPRFHGSNVQLPNEAFGSRRRSECRRLKLEAWNMEF